MLAMNCQAYWAYYLPVSSSLASNTMILLLVLALPVTFRPAFIRCPKPESEKANFPLPWNGIFWRVRQQADSSVSA